MCSICNIKKDKDSRRSSVGAYTGTPARRPGQAFRVALWQLYAVVRLCEPGHDG